MRKRITLFERIACTGSVNETPHRKWREIDLQLPCWLQLTLLGWCLASLPFLYGVSFTDPVVPLTSGVLAITLFVELDEWLPSVLGWVKVIEATCVSAKLLHRTRSERRDFVIIHTTNAII